MMKYEIGTPEFHAFSAACNRQGKLFELALRERYEMGVFVPVFMNSEAAKGLDSDFDHYQWAGNNYILEDVSRRYGIAPVDKAFAKPTEEGSPYWEACFWMGYTYRYWQGLTGEKSSEIYRQADYDKMLKVYPGYHTLSCEMAIDWLKEELKLKSKLKLKKGEF